jgi:hypothetical protein
VVNGGDQVVDNRCIDDDDVAGMILSDDHQDGGTLVITAGPCPTPDPTRRVTHQPLNHVDKDLSAP